MLDVISLKTPRGNGPHLFWRGEPPGFSRVSTGALDLRRGPQGPALVASGKASHHASCSGASCDVSPSPVLSWILTGSAQERQEDLQGRATIARVPQMSQFIPGKPVFPALPRLSSRGSTHTTVARGTALWKTSWESLLGKPQGKATDPLIHAKGSATLLLQLGRKAHVHAPTRDED